MTTRKLRKNKEPGKQCKDCDPGSRRPAPYPGPRCATHHRAVTKQRKGRSRESYLVRTYNLTEAQYNELYEFQGGMCYICGPFSGRNGRTKNLAVDHDHSCCSGRISCGKCVRGLVCDTCNKFLGLIRDNPEAFQRGIDYLTEPPARKVLNNE